MMVARLILLIICPRKHGLLSPRRRTASRRSLSDSSILRGPRPEAMTLLPGIHPHELDSGRRQRQARMVQGRGIPQPMCSPAKRSWVGLRRKCKIAMVAIRTPGPTAHRPPPTDRAPLTEVLCLPLPARARRSMTTVRGHRSHPRCQFLKALRATQFRRTTPAVATRVWMLSAES